MAMVTQWRQLNCTNILKTFKLNSELPYLTKIHVSILNTSTKTFNKDPGWGIFKNTLFLDQHQKYH